MPYLTKLEKILDKDAFAKVKADLGDKTLVINDGTYIPINDFNTKNDEVKALKIQVTDLKTTISDSGKKLKEFEPLAKDNEKLKVSITELKEANTTAIKTADAKLKETNTKNEVKYKKLELDTVMNITLSSYGAESEASKKAVLANIDITKVSVNNGALIGFKEQVDLLKKTSESLFFADKKEESKSKNKEESTGTKFIVGNNQNQNNDGSSTEEKIAGIYDTQE